MYLIAIKLFIRPCSHSNGCEHYLLYQWHRNILNWKNGFSLRSDHVFQETISVNFRRDRILNSRLKVYKSMRSDLNIRWSPSFRCIHKMHEQFLDSSIDSTNRKNGHLRFIHHKPMKLYLLWFSSFSPQLELNCKLEPSSYGWWGIKTRSCT